VSPYSIQALGVFPLGFLLVDAAVGAPVTTLTLLALLVTTGAGLIGRWLDNRKDENRHKWEQEERAAQAEAIRADLVAHRAELVAAITKQAEANHAQIENARAGLSEQQTAQVAKLRSQLSKEHEENKGLIADGIAAVQHMDGQ
jgi:hypothetical protein